MNDVAAIKVEKLLEQAGELIATDGLGRMMDLLEEYLDGSDYSATEMAAALLAMQLGETSTQTLPKEEFGDTGAEPGMVRMFMNIGKKIVYALVTFWVRLPGRAEWKVLS